MTKEGQKKLLKEYTSLRRRPSHSRCSRRVTCEHLLPLPPCSLRIDQHPHYDIAGKPSVQVGLSLHCYWSRLPIAASPRTEPFIPRSLSRWNWCSLTFPTSSLLLSHLIHDHVRKEKTHKASELNIYRERGRDGRLYGREKGMGEQERREGQGHR